MTRQARSPTIILRKSANAPHNGAPASGLRWVGSNFFSNMRTICGSFLCRILLRSASAGPIRRTTIFGAFGMLPAASRRLWPNPLQFFRSVLNVTYSPRPLPTARDAERLNSRRVRLSARVLKHHARHPLLQTECAKTSTVDYVFGLTHFKERSEEHTSELQSRGHLVCRLL